MSSKVVIQRTLMKQKDTTASLTFAEIPVSKIITEGQSVREAQDDDHVVELAMSIAKHGLLEPIVVTETDDGCYQLQAGFHRLCAFLRLRRDTIPANVRKDETGSTKTIALIENIVRRDMTLQEEVTAVNHMHREENLSTSSICDLLGKSTEWVQKRLMIINLPEDVKGDLMSGAISIKHAEIIGGVQDENIRAILLNTTIQNKLNTRQTSELARLYMETPTMESAIQEGIKKAQEIQAQKIPTRSCDYCGNLQELSRITFIATCPHCIDLINKAIQSLNEQEDQNNGNRE